MFDNPADAVAFFHSGKFNQRAVLAERFANAFVAVFVLHLHAARVRGNADVIGDEDQHRVRIGVAAVLFDRGELLGM